MDAGHPEDALRLLETALAHAPTDPDALLLKAEALVLLDRWEDAEETLEGAAQAHPGDPVVLLATAELVVDCHPDDQAALEAARAMAFRAEGIARKRGDDPRLIGDLLRVQGLALSTLGNSSEAVKAFESARDLLGDDDDLAVDLAMALFEALRFDDARAQLEEVLPRQPEDARVHHYLGLLDERTGHGALGEEHFARARQLDPEQFPDPVHLREDDFTAAVERAFESLPERVRTYLANVPVLVEDFPGVEDLQGDPPLSPLSLGMFRGLPGGARSHFDPWSQMPSSIVLFQKNLERYAGSEEELLEEIETTVLHEVGHYLGWDEEDLYERGLD